MTKIPNWHPAFILLSLLKEYRMGLDKWEDHYVALTTGRFKGDDEKISYRKIQNKFVTPLILRCDDEKFEFEDVFSILPGCFKTTYKDRETIMKDLRIYAERKYGVETV